MIPIISVVGRSDSGKTTLIERLIPELMRRGYRVGTIKHDAHALELDTEGKDSCRHARAGSAVCLVAGQSQIMLVEHADSDPDVRLLAGRFMSDVDLVLTEGFKKLDLPKIEVFRKESEEDPICGLDDDLVAMVSDSEVECDAPQFSTEQIAPLADLLEERFLHEADEPLVSLIVDGKAIPLKPFIRDMLAGSIRGLVRALRDCEDAADVDIRVRD